MEELNSIDKSLFLFFNRHHNSALDFLMYWASNKWIWIPFYTVLAYYVYKSHGKYFFLTLVFIALMITCSDQLSSAVIKNAVMRLRPCHDPSIAADVHLVNGYCGGNYGFVSSHASNAFALLTFLFFLFKRKYTMLRGIILAWAILVSYSRVYLGAHFPGDVACGALLGSLLGYIFWKIYLLAAAGLTKTSL